jgi:hypothetical protein
LLRLGWGTALADRRAADLSGGGKLLVNDAGDTVPVIVDLLVDKVRGARLFVRVMGCPCPAIPSPILHGP